jgi:hypothetical protein
LAREIIIIIIIISIIIITIVKITITMITIRIVAGVFSFLFSHDLFSAYDVTVPAEGKALVQTDISISIPEGCYGRVGW